MAMPAMPQEITTVEALLALPDDGLRHELLDGVHVVSPAPMPPHQLAVMTLYRLLSPLDDSGRGLFVFPCAGDLQLGPRRTADARRARSFRSAPASRPATPPLE